MSNDIKLVTASDRDSYSKQGLHDIATDEDGTIKLEPVVYCVLPVHNRRKITINCIQQLRNQCYKLIQVVVVDDGSADGTYEAVNGLQLDNVHIIRGDGSLWWGGAMSLGLKYVNAVANESDFILMLNDDVEISSNFIATLVSEHRDLEPPSILGAKQLESVSKDPFNRGYKIDFWRTKCEPISPDSEEAPDALPARGLLVPVSVNKRIGGVNDVLFPHAFSDIEYCYRAKERGVNLKISDSAVVLTEADDLNEKASPASYLKRIFSWRAKNNIRDQLLFFCVRGPKIHRLTAPLRFLIFKCSKLILKATIKK